MIEQTRGLKIAFTLCFMGGIYSLILNTVITFGYFFFEKSWFQLFGIVVKMFNTFSFQLEMDYIANIFLIPVSVIGIVIGSKVFYPNAWRIFSIYDMRFTLLIQIALSVLSIGCGAIFYFLSFVVLFFEFNSRLPKKPQAPVNRY